MTPPPCPGNLRGPSGFTVGFMCVSVSSWFSCTATLPVPQHHLWPSCKHRRSLSFSPPPVHLLYLLHFQTRISFHLVQTSGCSWHELREALVISADSLTWGVFAKVTVSGSGTRLISGDVVMCHCGLRDLRGSVESVLPGSRLHAVNSQLAQRERGSGWASGSELQEELAPLVCEKLHVSPQVSQVVGCEAPAARLGSASGTGSVLEDNPSGRSSKPWPPKRWTHFPNLITQTSAGLLLPPSHSPPAPPPPPLRLSLSNSSPMRIEFLFLVFFPKVFTLSFVNLTGGRGREHKRRTHTQFNEVFTDNSNCQILVPDDIVQSADAHNRLPSASAPR